MILQEVYPNEIVSLTLKTYKVFGTHREESSLLYLVGQFVFHIFLDSAQHERLEDHVKSGKLV